MFSTQNHIVEMCESTHQDGGQTADTPWTVHLKLLNIRYDTLTHVDYYSQIILLF